MNKPILSIVIPTFNRASLLKILLDSIVRDFSDWPADVELIVVDNASSDRTREVVLEVAARGVPVQCVTNAENVGMDRNLAACFGLASGKYFWQIGDDDILFEGTAQSVLAICRKTEFGILHLATAGFCDGAQGAMFATRIPVDLTIRTIDRQTLFRSINVFLTFISANVINRQAVLEGLPRFDFRSELNTFLPQLAWIYGALRVHNTHLHIPKPVLGALTGNTGGYRLVEVFGFNLARITECHLGAIIPNARRIMTNAALTRVIASEIRSQRISSSGTNIFAAEDVGKALKDCFGGKLYFRMLVSPIAFLPNRIGAAFFFVLRVFNRVNRQTGYLFL
jgi:abequosyltransferase